MDGRVNARVNARVIKWMYECTNDWACDGMASEHSS